MVIFLSYKSLILEFNAHPRCLLTTFYGSLHFIRTLVVPLLKQWEVWPPASMLNPVNNCESLRLNHGARAPSGGMVKSSLSPVSILCVTYALTYSNMAGMRVQLSVPTGNPVVLAVLQCEGSTKIWRYCTFTLLHYNLRMVPILHPKY